MKEEYVSLISDSLNDVPCGTFLIKHLNGASENGSALTQQLTVKTKGKGKIECFSVYPGIEVSFHQYLAENVRFHHEKISSVLEITYCLKGRIGWNMHQGSSVYLGLGDLCLHSMASCFNSEMILPLGYYEGITVTADLCRLKNSCPEILSDAGFDADKIYQKFCKAEKPIGIPGSTETEAIFSPLYSAKENFRIPYCKLKAIEALLYIQKLETNEEKELVQYGSMQTELIKEVRDFLVNHLDERFTIEELAKKYLINTSSLKSVFKAVYGMPIASYIKEYRMHRAMKLLIETNDSIAEIAKKVGYETQGKFTKAFKQSMQILPTEYRRLYR